MDGPARFGGSTKLGVTPGGGLRAGCWSNMSCFIAAEARIDHEQIQKKNKRSLEEDIQMWELPDMCNGILLTIILAQCNSYTIINLITPKNGQCWLFVKRYHYVVHKWTPSSSSDFTDLMFSPHYIIELFVHQFACLRHSYWLQNHTGDLTLPWLDWLWTDPEFPVALSWTQPRFLTPRGLPIVRYRAGHLFGINWIASNRF